LKLSEIKVEDAIEYGFIPDPEKPIIIYPARINNFEEIGWIDPFPFE
jgi:hypothetical protein